MIESKELRIGNLTDTGIVVEILEDKFYVHDGESSLSSVWDVIKPIPLTEEWLVKFGLLNNSRLQFLNKHDSNGKYYKGLDAFAYKLEVKHVHQLQNLYFALTGEELKIK